MDLLSLEVTLEQIATWLYPVSPSSSISEVPVLEGHYDAQIKTAYVSSVTEEPSHDLVWSMRY